MAIHTSKQNILLLLQLTFCICTYGQLGPVYFCLTFPALHFSAEPRAATPPAPPLASEWQAAAAPAPALVAGLDHLPLPPLSDPAQTQTDQHCNLRQSKKHVYICIKK